MEPRIWLIAGPTASGKSALALKLAEAIGGEIVNADSMQLYADLQIVTARPSSDDIARVPHHLFGAVDAAEGWSVGRWLGAATDVLAQIASRARPAIVAGGTGLYFRALTQGLAEIPSVPEEARRRAQADFATMGEDAFRDRLAAHDPEAAQRIASGDRQRLTRAWEVFSATDTALSAWQAAATPMLSRDIWRAVALEPPRDALYGRCDARLDAMVEAGVIAEISALVARKLDPELPIMKAVGVREFSAYLRGAMPLDEALTLAKRETRRYAKRQTTWMRGQMGDWPRISEIEPELQWRQFIAVNPGLTP